MWNIAFASKLAPTDVKRALWERTCPRMGRYIRCIYCVWKIAFASKLAPSVPGMGRNQPLESSGQTK
ncbi:hypothetical protein B1R35_29005 [Pseudomonas syringae pv. actinidiae]|nr:hypothetical protein B1R35_29005 [Pseudomonas syringae pv. actinidiae]